MKNIKLLSDSLGEIISNASWRCGCGQDGLRLSITRKGSIQAHCFNCGLTIFFNDAKIFNFENPWGIYQKEKPITKKMANGGYTHWYPKSRVRVFIPKKDV